RWLVIACCHTKTRRQLSATRASAVFDRPNGPPPSPSSSIFWEPGNAPLAKIAQRAITRMTKDENDWGSVFLPSSTEVRLSSRWEGASTLSSSANTIFAPIPGSGGDQNYFHADISFAIVTQSYLKIGRFDRQE